jgi:[acyl-carrier-protein] S-malonyltransferase
MQEAVAVGQGAMAAILGLDGDAVVQLCQDAAQGEVVQAANINSPEQIVISGHKGAVERAAELAKQRGAKRAILLAVSAPFHSALMQPAQDRLAADLCALTLAEPQFPVIANIGGEPVTTAADTRDSLTRQVTGTVQWERSMRTLISAGVETFVELGPGKVLCGLMRQIDRARSCFNVEDETSLQKTVKHFEQVEKEAN